MKKVLVVLISVFGFFLLIYLAVPYLVDFGLQKKTNNQNQNSELKEILKITTEFEDMLEKTQVEEFLNKDNLYENYSHNYTIKIPEGYKKNNGIGKFSSVQFYNENLGYVVGVNVGSTNLEPVNRKTNAKIIKEYKSALDKKKWNLEDDFKNSLIERGFNKVTLDNYKVVDYNNRLFIRLNFSAFRTIDNQENPASLVNFITYNEKLIYSFMFVSYQWNSVEKWESEIQKSMSNLIISKYITKKD